MKRPRIHLINQFEQVGGSELEALDLARLLCGHADVSLWATDVPGSSLSGPMPIELIDPRRGRFPHRGTFVFVGVYYHIGRWTWLTRPSRRIIIFNTPTPHLFEPFEHRTARTLPLGRVEPEVVYPSDVLRPMLGRPGIVLESPIDIRRFSPRAPVRDDDAGAFRIGRLSRDHPEKFHEDDAMLFRTMAEHGVDVRLMGGACLGLAPSARVVVSAPGAQPAPDFLRSLDCFVYRTRSDVVDGYARVVFEAMACGLPVVLGRHGGYAQYIRHGVNGFLFDTNEEALGYILRLRDSPPLREELGRCARQTVEGLYADSYEAKVIEFYTRPKQHSG
jgi:glycosyltransferase involved in cell wall biosynthesis